MDSETPPADIREQRLANLERMRELGFPPYGGAFERTGRLADLRKSFEDGREVQVAGRLVAKRSMGKSIFAHIDDGSDRFQVYVKKNNLSEEAFEAFKILDLGDHVGVSGALFLTRTEEQTVSVAEWTLLSKALLPLPEKWHGLQDVELRYRQRYLDLVANPEVREVFRKRIEMIRMIRSILAERGFMEVETPMIQAHAGGAAANPFKTHYESLGVDMFLRIAPELYLKRLLVGGMDKVYELNRNFRNEGLDRTHNPEFTMLEIYEAYGDLRSMMELIETLITTVAEEVAGSLKIPQGEDREVDLTRPWRSVTYRELILGAAGNDYYDLSFEEQKERAKSLGCDLDPAWDEVELTQEIFEKKIEGTLINPTFVTRLPVKLVPLAKSCEDDPSVVDVFELIIDGKEIAPAYSELNDPLEQRKRFEEQAAGEGEKVDEEFLTALEHGMPPAGGMGIGIDRLAMILTGSEAIRDVILFPQLKPKA